jgi:hypothetical protein
MKYYGLWYYSGSFGARSAHAISEHPETLLPMHEENIKDPDLQWHNFKENVSEIKVESIDCYTYNVETKSIEPYNDSHKTDGHDFYSFNTLSSSIYPNSFGLSFYDDVVIKITDSDGQILDNDDYDDLNKGEILIYLSRSCKDLWETCSDRYQKADDQDNFVTDANLPKFFYTDWPSTSPVEANVYYEEGIMNA